MRLVYISFIILQLVACKNTNNKNKQISTSLDTALDNEINDDEYNNYRDITGLVEAKEFHKLIVDCDTALIFDARPREIYVEEPRIKGGKLISDYSFFRKYMNTVSKNHQIMVYCGKEVRSPGVVKLLVNMGFNNVYELKDGLIAWKKLKLPLVDTDGNPYKY